MERKDDWSLSRSTEIWWQSQEIPSGYSTAGNRHILIHLGWSLSQRKKAREGQEEFRKHFGRQNKAEEMKMRSKARKGITIYWPEKLKLTQLTITSEGSGNIQQCERVITLEQFWHEGETFILDPGDLSSPGYCLPYWRFQKYELWVLWYKGYVKEVEEPVKGLCQGPWWEHFTSICSSNLNKPLRKCGVAKLLLSFLDLPPVVSADRLLGSDDPLGFGEGENGDEPISERRGCFCEPLAFQICFRALIPGVTKLDKPKGYQVGGLGPNCGTSNPTSMFRMHHLSLFDIENQQ